MALKRDWIPSPNYSSRGGSGVRLVVVHTAEGATTYKALGNYFASSGAGVSSHVGIDDQADRIGEYVKRPNKSWTQGSANPYCVSAELCGFAAWSPAEWEKHAGMLTATARWIAEECHYYGLPIVKLGTNEATHGGRGVCGHVEISGPGGHWDPGPSFPWAGVIAAAKSGKPYGDSSSSAPEWQLTPRALYAIGDEVPPDYILKSTHPDSQQSGGYFAVYPSGLVRRIGDDERSELKARYDVDTIPVQSKDAGTRLQEYDEALRGMKNS